MSLEPATGLCRPVKSGTVVAFAVCAVCAFFGGSAEKKIRKVLSLLKVFKQVLIRIHVQYDVISLFQMLVDVCDFYLFHIAFPHYVTADELILY